MQSIHGLFNKMINTSKYNMTTSLRQLKTYAEEERINPWFKKSATILALNTKINIQKSFWRLKFNMDSSGVQYNAAVIVKLKKLYNNIRKQYELNLFRAFLMIDKYGRTVDRGDRTKQKSPEPVRVPIQPQTSSVVVNQESNAKL